MTFLYIAILSRMFSQELPHCHDQDAKQSENFKRESAIAPTSVKWLLGGKP